MLNSRRYLKLVLINLGFACFGILFLEVVFGKWLRVKPYVPNILPEQGISHDLKQLHKEWGVTTRIPDENGSTLFTQSTGPEGLRGECTLLVLGGSTAEERVLNKEQTWTYQLFEELNRQPAVNEVCPDGLSVDNAAVNGHSIIANYFDVKHWISRFRREYSIAIIYQGINDFQGEILDEPKWYQSQWQELLYALRYNSVFFNALMLIRSNGEWKSQSIAKRPVISVAPHTKSNGAWKGYEIAPSVKDRLSVGLSLHTHYIEKLARALKRLGVRKIVWVTQTKPFCSLRGWPVRISVQGESMSQQKLSSISSWKLKDLKYFLAHTRIGDCIRLGIIRESYISSARRLGEMGLKSNLLDYGSIQERGLDSYDEYHKTPSGSQILWREFKRLGLVETVVGELYSGKKR